MGIKVGIVGTGYIGKIHAHAAQRIADAQLAAVVGNQPAQVEEFVNLFHVPGKYVDFQSMLKAESLDAIILCTPNVYHAPFAIAAMRAGVDVMVEKPMAMNASEASDMLAVSQEFERLLMVAHCWRFDEDVLWLKRKVDNGQIGQVLRTKAYGVHANWGPSGWFTEKSAAGGGAMADMGVHAIDTTRFLIGDPQPISVYARIGTYYGDYDVDDTGIVIINWDNSVTSYVESGWWQPHVDMPEAATQLYASQGFGSIFPTRLTLPNKTDHCIETLDPGYPFPRQEQCPQEMYNRQMAYFMDCVRTRQPPKPGGLEGWTNMKIIDAAYQSGRSGKVVDL